MKQTKSTWACLLLASIVPVTAACAPVTDESMAPSESLAALSICDGADAIDELKELTIVHPSVVTSSAADNAAGPAGGPLSFNRLMTRLAGPGTNPAAFVEAFFQNWAVDHQVGPGVVQGHPNGGIQSLLHDAGLWPRLSNGDLDLQRAPFRLLAVVNRLDLASSRKPNGEARLVFGGTTPGGGSLPMTLIFEYNLPIAGGETREDWASRWHALGDLAFGPAFNDALSAIVESYTAPEDLSQLRASEVFLSGIWTLREFHLDVAARNLVTATTAQTPDPSLVVSPALVDWVNENQQAILNNTHEVPAQFLGGQSIMSFPSTRTFNFSGTQWLMNDAGQPLVSADVRRAFAGQTCNGCHQSDTLEGASNIDAFYLISPTAAPSVDGTGRLSNVVRNVELPRRALALQALLPCPTPEPVSACSAEYTHQSWTSGSTVRIVVTNHGDKPVSNWRVAFTYVDGTTVSSFWNAAGIDTSAPSYAFGNASWNGSIAPGASTSFGFGTQRAEIPDVSVVCD